MEWRTHLMEGWRNLPGRLRLLVYGVLGASLGLIALAFFLPPEQQLWAVLGLFGLFVAVQGVILTRMWRQRPALRKARQAFLRGDFDTVIALLEAERASAQADAVSLTLLGNAYRQLARLTESEGCLQEALAADPASPLASYGLGRTLLAKGEFDAAARLIGQAIQQGAQPIVYIELALAFYCAGEQPEALAALEKAAAFALEPHRQLMAAYLGWQCGGLEAQVARSRMLNARAGLAMWQAEAARFAATPYGAALGADVARMEGLLAEEANL
ncbi:MAG: hypothetical protein JXN59_07060 [Anaerolineae bacterium]|nr:hypothetical protein [Anaerolineae bacterium]